MSAFLPPVEGSSTAQHSEALSLPRRLLLPLSRITASHRALPHLGLGSSFAASRRSSLAFSAIQTAMNTDDALWDLLQQPASKAS